MKNFVAIVSICVMIVGMSNRLVRADLISLTPSQDNSVFAENNNSAGAKGFFYVGVTNGAGGTTIRRAFLQFDLTGSIPAGSTINSVTLSLERSFQGPGAGNDVLDLHRVLQSWGEGTSTGGGQGGTGYAPSVGSVTWNHRFFSTQSWTTPGGDIGPISGSLMLNAGNGSFLVPSQAGMVADVQNWVNNPGSNFGWALKYSDENTIGTARQFYSREANASLRPTLTIDFSAIPEPGSFLLIGVASLIASTYRPSRRGHNKSTLI